MLIAKKLIINIVYKSTRNYLICERILYTLLQRLV